MMLERDAFWDDVLKHIFDADRLDLREVIILAERRRKLANYDTGSITLADATLLRGLSNRFVPKRAVEIGTFIGTSTFSIRAGHLYTCDKDNACVPSTSKITTFPRTRSTRMLQDLVVRLPLQSVSFWFFDGRIKEEDLAYIVKLACPVAKYVFHDYYGDEKGVINVNRLRPVLAKHYQFIEPIADGSSTLAVLMPGHGE